MKCPYAVNITTTTVIKNNYNEDSLNISQIIQETNESEFVDCKKENCGAFRDNKCCYRGIE